MGGDRDVGRGAGENTAVNSTGRGWIAGTKQCPDGMMTMGGNGGVNRGLDGCQGVWVDSEKNTCLRLRIFKEGGGLDLRKIGYITISNGA